MLYPQNALLGAALIVAAELLFATMGAAVKAASVGLPNEMIVFFRNAIATLLLLPLALNQGGLDNLKTRIPHWHLLRAGIGLSAMYCFFFALGHLALAEGMILKMTTPLFMPLFAWLLLRETSPPIVLIAIPIGFAGVWAVLDPTGAFNWVSLVGLAGGALAALAKAALRRLGRSEPVARTVFYFAALSSVISSIPLIWAWVTPSAQQLGLLALLACAGTGGQLLMTRAYAIGEASRIGAFTYCSVLFGAGYGYIFWQETLSQQFVIGAFLIALAGVLALQKRRTIK